MSASGAVELEVELVVEAQQNTVRLFPRVDVRGVRRRVGDDA